MPVSWEFPHGLWDIQNFMFLDVLWKSTITVDVGEIKLASWLQDAVHFPEETAHGQSEQTRYHGITSALEACQGIG